MKEIELKKYKQELAKVAVRHGINLTPNRNVYIMSPIEHEELASFVAEECYKLGAKKVLIKWISPKTSHLALKYESEDELSSLPSYEKAMKDFLKKDLTPRILILSEYFTDTKDLDLNKINKVNQKLAKISLNYRETLDGSAPWTIIPAPNKVWAKKIFPNEKEDVALNKAWELFFKVTRIELNKGLSNWKKHEEELKKRAKWLNSLDIKYLHYESKNGTDLTVEMIEDYLFIGGSHLSPTTKKYFNPNIPTEECFTSPKRDGTNGVVYSSKPLIYQGRIIEDFSFRFKNGKIIEVHAKKNEKLLKELVNIDKTSCYLGEVALVPFNSPINASNKIFYHTLFDENAVCHLAFGTGFPMCYKKYKEVDAKYLIDVVGINVSSIHEDFMIGTKDLKITAITKNNKKVVIFKNGTWAK